MGLTRARRLTNPRDSFALRADSLAGRSVLLLDDVTTTGATLRAATAALAEARPRQLTPLALAGTPAL
jgi:predicted amidophosphoribosyltransferase